MIIYASVNVNPPPPPPSGRGGPLPGHTPGISRFMLPHTAGLLPGLLLVDTKMSRDITRGFTGALLEFTPGLLQNMLPRSAGLIPEL